MSNALTAFIQNSSKDLTLSEDKMADALQNTVEDATTGTGAGVTYLNFSGKSGVYSLGRDKEDVDPEARYVIEPMSVFRGWQCWKSSKPVDKMKWSVYQVDRSIDEHELPDHGPYRETAGEGWKKLLGFGAIATDGSGQQIEFSTDSVSGRNAVGALLDEIGQRSRAKDPNVPVISFDREQFKAQEQTNWKPKLTVRAWATREQVAALLSDQVPYTMEDLEYGKKLTAAQKKKLAA